MRTIKRIHKPEYDPIQDLVTYRVLPTRSIRYMDPFLFLNHHGPQVYPPQNNGLPFGPHPHRGMETVTFILEGDIAHFDNGGHKSVINSGGVQWMRAGKGLIHSEVSSDEFKEKGGSLEILQLWINLPARSKMAEPYYEGLQEADIPTISLDDGKVKAQLVFGEWDGTKAAFTSDIGVQLNTVYFKEGGKLSLDIPEEENIFFYLVSGTLEVNGKAVDKMSLVEFEHDSSNLEIRAAEDSVLILGHSKSLNEPVVSQGPFVMNTEEEIRQAYEDYRNGKFGGSFF